MGLLSHGVLQFVITTALFLHAVAHAIALVALIGQTIKKESSKQMQVQSWLLPSSGSRKSAYLALPFWFTASLAFFGSAAASWGVLVPAALWDILSIAGALISITGIILTGGIWPGSPTRSRAMFNTAIALTMNLIILSASVWMQWLPSSWVIAGS